MSLQGLQDLPILLGLRVIGLQLEEPGDLGDGVAPDGNGVIVVPVDKVPVGAENVFPTCGTVQVGQLLPPTAAPGVGHGGQLEHGSHVLHSFEMVVTGTR